MLETLLGVSVANIIGALGLLEIIVTIITEVLKNILPQNFPTKALVLIVSLIVTITFTLIFGAISVKSIFVGIVGSFAVAFISMYGWDTFNELIVRFKNPRE